MPGDVVKGGRGSPRSLVPCAIAKERRVGFWGDENKAAVTGRSGPRASFWGE